MALSRPSNELSNKTNVNPSVNRFTEATAEDFNETSSLLNEYADAIEGLQLSESPNPYYGNYTSIAILTTAYPAGEENAWATIDPGVGQTRQIAVWDINDSKWVVQGAVSDKVFVANYASLPGPGVANTWYVTVDNDNLYLWYNNAYQLISTTSVTAYNKFVVKENAETISASVSSGNVLVKRNASNEVVGILFGLNFTSYLKDYKNLFDGGVAMYIKLHNTSKQRALIAKVSAFTLDVAEEYMLVELVNTISSTDLAVNDFIEVYLDIDIAAIGGTGVQTVTGDGVDNSDPDNPVLSFPNADEVEDTSTTNKFVDQAILDKLAHILVTQEVDLDELEAAIDALANGMVYMDDWDASTGVFPGGGTAEKGWFYNVSVSGTVDGVEFTAGDAIIAKVDGASVNTYAGNWNKRDATDAVTAVVGLTGTVTAAQIKAALVAIADTNFVTSTMLAKLQRMNTKTAAIPAGGAYVLDYANFDTFDIPAITENFSFSETGLPTGSDRIIATILLPAAAFTGTYPAAWTGNVKGSRDTAKKCTIVVERTANKVVVTYRNGD